MTYHQETLLDAAETATRSIYEGHSQAALTHFDEMRAELSASEVARLDERLRKRLSWAGYRPQPSAAKRVWQMPAKPRDVDVGEVIAKSPQTAALFMHSHVGYFREQAVNCFEPVDTAGRAALLLRCNDWVENVRVAALSKLGILARGWTAEELKGLVLFTVDRINEWQRGGAVAAGVLQDHPEWQKALRLVLLQETNGPMVGLLRKNLRSKGSDHLLPELAVDAKSALVRAVAAKAILEGCARWHASTEWQWIDKIYGLRRKVQKWSKRDIPFQTAVQRDVLATASQDKSAVVRKLAAEYLIREGIEAHPAIYHLLIDDKSNGVRERMCFCKRKWSGQATVREND